MMYRLKKMAYLLALGNGRCRRLPKPRVFRDRNQPMDVMDDDELIARYRMPRHMIAQICEMLDEDLRRISHCSQALPVSTQVMVALSYFATGSFQRGTGDLHGISQPSASRCIRWTDVAFSRVSVIRIYLGCYCRRIAAVILKQA